VGQAGGERTLVPRSGIPPLRRPVRKQAHAPPELPRQPQMHLSEVKWKVAREWADINWNYVPSQPEAYKNQTGPNASRQKACLAILPNEDRTLPHRPVPQLGKEPTNPSVLVVLVQDPDSRAPAQNCPQVEEPTKGVLGGSQRGDRPRQRSLQDLALRRRTVQQPFLDSLAMADVVRTAGPPTAETEPGSEASEWERREWERREREGFWRSGRRRREARSRGGTEDGKGGERVVFLLLSFPFISYVTRRKADRVGGGDHITTVTLGGSVVAGKGINSVMIETKYI